MTKLWGGRFSEESDRRFARFNASFHFDRRLLPYDVQATIAHVQVLQQADLFSAEESRRLQQALLEILERSQREPAYLQQAIEQGIEDVHSFVESELVKLVGPLGARVHTGRSRNDQVATDLRLFLRSEIDRTLQEVKRLQEALLDLAERHFGEAIPGYTHLQKAQPVLLAHYLLAYFEMLQRDGDRLLDARCRVNICPLGSAALAGSNHPLDRQLAAKLLGFEGITRNSMDAVSDRDFVIEFCAGAALTLTHLSRLAEDLILYSSTEFGFLEFSDRVTSGSSIMPQKKNPDALELIRGKSARLIGHLTGQLALVKGIPMTYNKDLQEDKEALFDTVDTLQECLNMAVLVLRNTEIKTDRLRAAVQSDFLNATEMADYLADKGLPFRQAHEIVGKVVLAAIGQGVRLEDLSLSQLQQFSPLFEEDLYTALSLEKTLERKSVPGGTSPLRVAEALKEARGRLKAHSA